jgi:DNA topoisomerase-3
MGDENVPLFKDIFEKLEARYPKLSQYCDKGLITRENKNIFNSAALEDHHALIPLAVLPNGATPEEKNIYEIVLYSFFTVCMKDYICNKRNLFFQSGQYTFRSQVKEVVQTGFKEFEKAKNSDETEQEVGSFNEESCKIVKLETLHKETIPPKEYSIDTLLGFMENPSNKDGEKLIGLGTPATRASIIKILFDREYIREENKKLSADSKGLFLLGQLSQDEKLVQITGVSQTTAWEKQLKENPAAFEASIVEYIRACIKSDRPRVIFQKEIIGKCPLCGKPVIDGPKSYYCSGYKDIPSCAFSVWKTIVGASVTKDDIKLLLSGRPTDIKKCINQKGLKFQTTFILGEDKRVSFLFEDQNGKATTAKGGSK